MGQDMTDADELSMKRLSRHRDRDARWGWCLAQLTQGSGAAMARSRLVLVMVMLEDAGGAEWIVQGDDCTIDC